jgi:hypothetical protein
MALPQRPPLTFTPGETSKTVSVPITGKDPSDEQRHHRQSARR